MLIEELKKQGHLHSIDLLFAEHSGATSEKEKLLLATLMAVSREGHLCLDVEAPHLPEDDPRWKEALWQAFGSFTPPSTVVQEGSLLYVQKNWVYETTILKELERLMQQKMDILTPPAEPTLNREQKEALDLVLSHPLSLITGGPGTGKTFVVRHLVQAVLQTLGPHASLILAAPTGKAAARLKQQNPPAKTGTLHALLGIRSSSDLDRLGEGFLKADVVVVDECSMLDARLFAYFLSAIQPGTRVVLMGDADQLSPIESGTIFSDLRAVVPTARLIQCMRAERKELIDLAESIRKGEIDHLPCRESIDILAVAKAHFPSASSQEPPPETSFDTFRMLSTKREGVWGVNTLNSYLANHFLSTLRPGLFLALPILVKKSDPILGIYNGDSAVLVRNLEKPLYALFTTSPGQIKKIPAAALPPYEYGYCLSVHKSQGSEFEEVLLLLPSGSEVFGKEVLYTAVTRARKKVDIVGKKETLHKTVQTCSGRVSGILYRHALRKA